MIFFFFLTVYKRRLILIKLWNLLQELYQRALSIKSAIPHPRIMGIIRECGGKMYMAERRWAEAATDFFEAFKNYDEAGNHRRIQCLKYVSNKPFCVWSWSYTPLNPSPI